jgi:copper chaperone
VKSRGGRNMNKKVFVEGMSCSHCVRHVENALSDIKGVKNVKVDLAKKLAQVEMDIEISDDEIKAAVEDAGYEVLRIE